MKHPALDWSNPAKQQESEKKAVQSIRHTWSRFESLTSKMGEGFKREAEAQSVEAV